MKIRAVKKLFTLKPKDILLLIEAFGLYHGYQLIILLFPFSVYKKSLGKINEESPKDMDYRNKNVIDKIAWSVNAVGRHSPWKKKCLAKSITAQKMLKKRGFASTLYLGLKKAGDHSGEAHAWLRCGHIILTGGSIMNEFTEIARFCTTP